jgi:type IV pilus assembly protein PilZ
MELNSELHFTGKVVWITPSGAQHNRRQGLGVEFQGETGQAVREQIETYLGDMLDSPQITHTL